MGPDTITIDGLVFTVLSRFSGDNRIDRANAYMALHPHAAVLTERDGAVILADRADKGEPVKAAGEDTYGAGWFSVFDLGASR